MFPGQLANFKLNRAACNRGVQEPEFGVDSGRSLNDFRK